MALEQYFFWVCLRDSIPGFIILFFDFGDFHNLTVNDHTSSDNTQNDKDGYEDTLGSQPSVKVSSNKKTKSDATDHCKAQLRYNVKIFDPDPVSFVVEKLFFLFWHPA